METGRERESNGLHLLRHMGPMTRQIPQASGDRCTGSYGVRNRSRT